jgi:hypothetical protein
MAGEALFDAFAEQRLQFAPGQIAAGISGKKALKRKLLDRFALQGCQGLKALVLLAGDVDGQTAHANLARDT